MAKIRQKDFQAAARLLEAAVQDCPESASAYGNLGVAYWKLGEHEEAVKMLEQAAILDEADPRPLEFLGYIFTRLGKWDDARRALGEAFERFPQSPRILTALGLVECRAGDAGQALALFNKALELNPGYPPALYNLGRTHQQKTNNSERAKEYFEKYVRLAPKGFRARTARKFLESVAGPPKREKPVPPAPAVRKPEGKPARASTPAPPQGDVGSAERVIAAAAIAAQNEEFDEALIMLSRAVREYPKNADALWRLATLYDKHLKYDRKAAETYRRFEQIFPNDPRAVQKRKYEEETRKAQLKHTTDSERPEQAQGRRGSAGSGRQKRAEKPVEPDPRAAQVAFEQGLECHRAEDWPGAVSHYIRALAYDRTSAKAAYNLGLAYKSVGNPGRAKGAFRHSLKIRPDMTKAGYMLAVVHHELKENDEAVEQIQGVLKVKPDYAKARYLLGLIYYEKGRPDLAKTQFEQCIRSDPDDPSAQRAKEFLRIIRL